MTFDDEVNALGINFDEPKKEEVKDYTNKKQTGELIAKTAKMANGIMTMYQIFKSTIIKSKNSEERKMAQKGMKVLESLNFDDMVKFSDKRVTDGLVVNIYRDKQKEKILNA
jgi:hypothetical protein